MVRSAAVNSLSRSLLILIAAVLLSACPAKTTRPPAPQPAEPPSPATATPASPAVSPPRPADERGIRAYRVNPQESAVHILVYRGGTLGRLGHNHVMTVRSLEGRVWTHPTPSRSGFDLAFPVAELAVDDPQARSLAGEDFAGDVKQSDRDATRRNMLRAETLDAARYPRLTLRSVSISGAPHEPRVVARITIKDRSQDVTITPSFKVTGTRLIATGELTIKQTDFGITPFTAALGALAVQDALRVKFSVVADEEKTDAKR